MADDDLSPLAREVVFLGGIACGVVLALAVMLFVGGCVQWVAK